MSYLGAYVSRPIGGPVPVVIEISFNNIQYSSNRRRLRIVSHGLVKLPKFELVEIALRDLANDARGLASDNREARDDHVGGHDGAIEYAYIVLDDRKLVDDDVVANVDVGTDGGGLDDSAFADKDVVANT